MMRYKFYIVLYCIIFNSLELLTKKMNSKLAGKFLQFVGAVKYVELCINACHQFSAYART